ncbi:MAG: PQQ-binding-like beta-propeller repeat protein [Planctomycetales bacterium]|nr:PQQ-binding-like beta-propeller repeat protein [Planctomycetales bacterium]
MQQQAQQFIELLVSQQLLAPEIVEELRRQVSESKTRLSAELLAKLLVDNGHLTKFQATKLIAALREPDDGGQQEEPARSDDELGFATDDESDGDSVKSPKQRSAPKVAAVFVDDEDAQGGTTDEVEIVEVVDVVDEVAPLNISVEEDDEEPVDLLPSPVTRIVKPPQAQTNPFDSFRILGIGLILAIVSVAGIFLVRHFWRGNADQRLKAADEAYSQRSYESAAQDYAEFAKVFSTDERTSYAKVRAALSRLRKDVESTPNPVIGLQTALEVLPPIAEESGLADQRSDLTGALIGLAEKFNARADSIEVNSERKELMTEMDRLMGLIQNPQFVGNSQRDQQAPTLARINEDRKRIEREINRDDELAAALEIIDSKLAEKDVLFAYQVRKELTSKYPLLKSDPQLMQRVKTASQIQQSQVAPSSLSIQLTEDGIEQEDGGRIVLANRTGNAAADLAGKIIYVKVKGSVYGLQGNDGKVLWRRFVGSGFKTDPIRLDSTSESDVLVCDPEQGMVSRLEAATGKTLWSVGFGRPVHTPTVEGEDLLVATFDGVVTSLDAESGQTKWSTQLPQSVPVSPTLAFNKKNLYLPGEHSNLYVLSRTDGSCQQVYYLNNREGALAVSPILLMGQLFVFENRNTESANIRVFETDDEGLIARESPDFFQMSGNVVVSPQVDGRKIVIQSDLGECVVLDVEPTLETRKVSEIARNAPNSMQPKLSWILAENSQLWVAGERLTRFDLVVTKQELRRLWSTDDGDEFAGPMQKYGDTLVHSRVLRGSRGVRVAAVEADSGDPIWDVDLGVPVTFISSSGSGKFDIINSSGMYFGFNGQKLVDKADEFPSKGAPATMLLEPVPLGDGIAALFNASKPSQFALYSRDGQKIRLVSTNFGGAEPSSAPVRVGESIGIGLNNGRFCLISPTTGAQTATPFQLPMVPGQKVVWNTPVYLEDSKSLIVASNTQKLLRLGVGSSLRVLTEVDLESPLSGPLCVPGNKVLGIESTPAGSTIQLFDANSLARGPALALEGNPVAGPFPLEGDCLIQTNTHLLRVNSEAETVWQIDFPYSQLLVAPLLLNGKMILATVSGQLRVLDPATGAEDSTIDTRQPFTSAPVAHSAGVLIGSDEGAVIALPLPKPSAGNR